MPANECVTNGVAFPWSRHNCVTLAGALRSYRPTPAETRAHPLHSPSMPQRDHTLVTPRTALAMASTQATRREWDEVVEAVNASMLAIVRSREALARHLPWFPGVTDPRDGANNA
jgi:hypothetical protein